MADARRRAAEDARRQVELREQAAAERRANLQTGAEPESDSLKTEEPAPVIQSWAWKKNNKGEQQEGPDAETAEQEGEDMFPTEEECALGVQRIISGTKYGMREGLELLGLPSEEFDFVRGKRLVIAGQDIRSTLNDIIHQWMTENKEEFQERLKYLQKDIWDTEAHSRRVRENIHWKGLAADEGSWGDGSSEGGDSFGESVATPPLEDPEEPGEPPGVAPGDAQATAAAPAEEPGGSESAGRAALATKPTPTVAWTLPNIEGDLYELLGIEPSATLSEIRARFRVLVSSEHPSKGGDEALFEKRSQAFGVLTHHGKRQAYDARRRGVKVAASEEGV